MRTRLFCALTLLGGCSDSPGPDPDPQELPLSAALVSPSVVRPVTASNAAVVVGETFISMVPGTDAEGRRTDIRNLRSGASATSPMVNGGFDPVAVPAEAGDTLAITVVHQAGDDTTAYSVVPLKKKPTVVRSSPTTGKTDVPLNSVIQFVFNQPMDGVSLADALHLRQGGVDVPGSVIGVSAGGVILSGRFVPTSPLAPLSTYELSVSTSAQSPGGDPLDAPRTVEFTTASTAGAARLRVVHAATGVGDMDVLIDGNEVASDLPFKAATAYLELSAGVHDVWYQVSIGTMDQTLRSFSADSAYTVLPCCVSFPLGGFLYGDDNSEPPAGSARVRVIDYASFSNGVKIYLTAPDADLATATPIATINVLDASPYVEVPAGEYRIRITPFDSDIVEIDSGTLTLGAGQVRTAIAVDAPTGGAPYDLFMLEDLN